MKGFNKYLLYKWKVLINIYYTNERVLINIYYTNERVLINIYYTNEKF